MRKEISPEKAARRAARRQTLRFKVQAQRDEAQQLRRIAQGLWARSSRRDRQAALEIKQRCADSLAFRRVWSTLLAERSRVGKGPRQGDFDRGSRAVQGGRVNPR